MPAFPIETLVLAAVCALLGYAFGRRTSTRAAALRSLPKEASAQAYKELFAAFVDADRALMNASMAETTDGQVSEEAKERARTSLNELFKTFESNRFMLPGEIHDAMSELFSSRLGATWSDQVDDLRRTRDSIYSIARRDIDVDA